MAMLEMNPTKYGWLLCEEWKHSSVLVFQEHLVKESKKVSVKAKNK